MDALAGQCIQISGGGGDQGLAFAGAHFRNLTAVQHHSADHLDVEMPHVEEAAARFADYREGFHQKVIQGRAIGQFFAEFNGFGGKFAVRQRLDGGLKSVDGRDGRAHRLDFTLVAGTEYFGEDCVNHSGGTYILARRGWAARDQRSPGTIRGDGPKRCCGAVRT